MNIPGSDIIEAKRRRRSPGNTHAAVIIDDSIEDDVGLFKLDNLFTFRMETNIVKNFALEDSHPPLAIEDTTHIAEAITPLQKISRALNTFTSLNSDTN